MKRFCELSEREILSVAVASEEEDNRVYLMFAEDLRDRYPATAQTFAKMAEVEAGHRDRLTALYKERFGPNLVPNPAQRREVLSLAPAYLADAQSAA